MGYRLLHWGPIVALSIVSSISAFTILCHVEWWPLQTKGAFVDMFVFLLWNFLTLFNFFRAAFKGPGLVPYGWTPANPDDRKSLQYCTICEGYKVPRSHHCRKCQRCVMKMDHHCPWINNCLGHFNHANFTAFLFFAPCGCIHSLFILIPSLYRAIYRNYYIFYGTGREPIVDLGAISLIGSMLSVGLAFGVVLAVGGLFVVQLRSIIRNETGIETWIKDKAEYRDREEDEKDFVYPYHLGRWNNLRMVLHLKTRPQLNGIWWPVRDGCNQFTLTEEQIKQKKEKRGRSVLYEVVRSFSGSLCPITYGLRVCCCPPCMDEQRVRLQEREIVLVSRFRKHWLYGDKVHRRKSQPLIGNKEKRERGWFPRKCVRRLGVSHGDLKEYLCYEQSHYTNENSLNDKVHLNEDNSNENSEEEEEQQQQDTKVDKKNI